MPETISIPNSDETPHAKSEADEDCASGYIFHSLEAKATLRQALKVARYTSNVMIYGESGVRKEIIARIIHQNSERKSFPMVKINCAAIPEHLLESELFGYEKVPLPEQTSRGKSASEKLHRTALYSWTRWASFPLLSRPSCCA